MCELKIENGSRKHGSFVAPLIGCVRFTENPDLIWLRAIHRKTQKAQESFCKRNSFINFHHSNSIDALAMLIPKAPHSCLHSLQLLIN
jgi:hypothetical protein